MANLFAQTGTKKDSLVEFRAGLLWKDKDSAWVRPDKRKGQVIVKRGTDDQLIHFMWKDRAAGSTELDLILFPDDATWRRVKECTTGRVYVLEFKTGNKNFFWMQEPSTSKDDEYSDLINDHINNKAPQSAGNAGLQSLFGQLGPGAGAAYDELSQASAGYGRSSTPSATRNTSSTTTGSGSSTTTTSSSNSAASSLSSRLADVMNRLPSGSGAAAAPSGPGAPRLTDVLNTTDVLATGALEDKDVLAELQKLLPENEQNSVIQTLRSPQFRQAVDHLNAVLKQSPQALSTLLTSFGVAQPSEPASNRLETFLRAIMEASKKETDKKDDSNKMDESK